MITTLQSNVALIRFPGLCESKEESKLLTLLTFRSSKVSAAYPRLFIIIIIQLQSRQFSNMHKNDYVYKMKRLGDNMHSCRVPLFISVWWVITFVSNCCCIFQTNAYRFSGSSCLNYAYFHLNRLYIFLSYIHSHGFILFLFF